jgi:hypothetical protein
VNASRRLRSLLTSCVIAAGLVACDGGGGGGGGGNGGGTTPPPPAGQNPCATASLETGEELVLRGDEQAAAAARARKNAVIDGDPRWRVLDSLWTHRQAAARREPRAAVDAPRDSVDVGEIAVLQDTGDLILPPNTFDLRNLGLRFTRNGAGGYDVRRIDAAFRTTLGTRLTLTDDDSAQVNVGFGFQFYDTQQTVAFVNSDGNITFGEEDRASTERNVARLLTGPPRVSPFLVDLDPSTGNGRVFVHSASDQYTVTWCNVRQFESQRVAIVQVSLLPDGAIEMKFDNGTNVTDAVVGLSPGRTADFTPVNLGEPGPTSGGGGAVGERFAQTGTLDVVAVSNKFYVDHPDNYDQLVIWTDARVIRDAFAYEQTVANEIRGIGLPVFDLSRDFGSGGRLRSLAVMDFIGKYPEDSNQKFLGENTTLSVLGQEVGHRWLAFLEFRDHNGQPSDLLLGRGESHWSFFFDSDASVMEGNDIEDLGGGSFRTVDAVSRYSRLDQYAMGLLPATSVPPFFYVENPTNPSPFKDRDDGPQIGVTFTGTRRDVLIQDVIAVHGSRSPSSAESARVHRQAFIHIVGAGRTANAAEVAKVDRIRSQWEGFFLQATEGRMRAETRLR